jgi:hypothetical protein
MSPPPLRDMGSPQPMMDVFNELEEIIRGKGIASKITPRISKEALENHIEYPLKEINLINSFLSMLKRGVGPMPMELVSYEVSFKQLIFRCIGISYQHEVWSDYLDEEAHGQL